MFYIQAERLHELYVFDDTDGTLDMVSPEDFCNYMLQNSEVTESEEGVAQYICKNKNFLSDICIAKTSGVTRNCADITYDYTVTGYYSGNRVLCIFNTLCCLEKNVIAYIDLAAVDNTSVGAIGTDGMCLYMTCMLGEVTKSYPLYYDNGGVVPRDIDGSLNKYITLDIDRVASMFAKGIDDMGNFKHCITQELRRKVMLNL